MPQQTIYFSCIFVLWIYIGSHTYLPLSLDILAAVPFPAAPLLSGADRFPLLNQLLTEARKESC